ncbi:MAG: hypothetical protein H0U95_19165 [Bacteroidetes bacterium]|nr:hypothetical protein [Bacteroidota bacterium]
MKNLLCLTAGAILLTAACSAPKLSSYAAKTDLKGKAKYDFNQSKIRENGKGFAVDMGALGKMPKRIALVSFYIDDPGITHVSGTNATGKSFNTSNTGSANGKIFANDFSSKSIETLKASFKTYGIDVLTPSEFLTDDDKKQAYNDFVVKHTAGNKIGEKFAKWAKKMGNSGTTIEMDEAADGYKLVKINKTEMSDAKKKSVGLQNLNGSIDGQMIESVGYDLCKSLEVDAVMIIFNTQLADTKWSKTRFWLSAVNMHILGPNPTPLKEGKKDNNFYSKGLFYCGVRMPFKKGLAINPKIKDEAKKAENDKLNDVAYKNMIAGCANKIGGYLQKELDKSKK